MFAFLAFCLFLLGLIMPWLVFIFQEKNELRSQGIEARTLIFTLGAT
jgi:hypothetical protein